MVARSSRHQVDSPILHPRRRPLTQAQQALRAAISTTKWSFLLMTSSRRLRTTRHLVDEQHAQKTHRHDSIPVMITLMSPAPFSIMADCTQRAQKTKQRNEVRKDGALARCASHNRNAPSSFFFKDGGGGQQSSLVAQSERNDINSIYETRGSKRWERIVIYDLFGLAECVMLPEWSMDILRCTAHLSEPDS